MKTLAQPKRSRLLAALLALITPATLFAAGPDVSPAEAAQLVKDGKAVLVDVREPAEWRQSGVAAPAVLLAKSDFDGKRVDWAPFLESVGKRTIIVYCRSGRRSAMVAEGLKEAGYEVLNAGGFAAWRDAGLPVRQIGAAGEKR